MSSSSNSLSPPIAFRNRSNSNSCILGRRCSNSQLKLQLPTSTQSNTLSPTVDNSPSQESPTQTSQTSEPMLLVFAHRVLEWVHWQPSHPRSTSSSKSQTPDLLPTSAPPTQTSFPDFIPEKQSSSTSTSPLFNLSSFPSIHTPILLVILLFPISTVLVLLALYTLPISVSWPHNISDLAQLGTELHGYSQSGFKPMLHVIAVMSLTAVWKHAWSIPGSVVWNVLAGALFSPAFATVLLTLLTTIGSACATLLAMPLGPFIHHVFPRALDMTRSALQGTSTTSTDVTSSPKSPAWVRLSVLRLIGVVPWSGINIACGVSAVPLADCMLGAFIGTLPWTAVTCQIGDILQTVASHPSPTPQTVSSLLASPAIIAKLAVLSFLSLAPILARDRLKALIAGGEPADVTAIEGELDERTARRRTWVQGFRNKLASRSRSRATETQLETLVREKVQMENDERLPS